MRYPVEISGVPIEIEYDGQEEPELIVGAIATMMREAVEQYQTPAILRKGAPDGDSFPVDLDGETAVVYRG